MIVLRLSAGREFELYFPALDGTVQSAWLELAASVFVHLTEMDNEIQREMRNKSAGVALPKFVLRGRFGVYHVGRAK